MWVNGDYRAGISVMDRHLARAAETLKVAQAMQTWVNQLTPAAQMSSSHHTRIATAIGLTEAPRGALGHWLQIAGGKISRYQIITPTCWNASPRDSGGKLGPIEQALIGTPVQNADQPVEVLRVIHSFDPASPARSTWCGSSQEPKSSGPGHFYGGEEIHSHNHDHGPSCSHDQLRASPRAWGLNRARPRILIAGLGNYLLRDDGIGVHAVGPCRRLLHPAGGPHGGGRH